MAELLDRNRLEALYRLHEQAMYNMAYRWVWDAAEAQDIVQEAFARLWQRRRQLRSAGVEAYAYRTVLNLAASRRRRQRLRQWLPLLEEQQASGTEADPAQGLHREREGCRLRRAMDKLPAKLKQALMLCEFSEYSYEEVGRILGIPAGTVGSRRSKALKLLAADMKRRPLNQTAGRYEEPL